MCGTCQEEEQRGYGCYKFLDDIPEDYDPPTYQLAGFEPDVFKGCPWDNIKNLQWCLRMLRLHNHYANGFLWTNANLADQPNRYLRAMEIIHSETNAVRNEEIKNMKRKGGKGGNKY